MKSAEVGAPVSPTQLTVFDDVTPHAMERVEFLLVLMDVNSTPAGDLSV